MNDVLRQVIFGTVMGLIVYFVIVLFVWLL